jgi:hypothetical protein
MALPLGLTDLLFRRRRRSRDQEGASIKVADLPTWVDKMKYVPSRAIARYDPRDDIIQDARRIKEIWKEWGIKPPPAKLSAVDVAVELHYRITGQSPSNDERHDLVQRVMNRMEHPPGTSRAARSRAK